MGAPTGSVVEPVEQADGTSGQFFAGRLHDGCVLGPYVIGSELGRGGMAIVYRGWREGRDPVAIKVLPEVLVDPDFRTRFEREATAAALRHPNILEVLDHGSDSGVSYIVTELVRGGTLCKRMGAPLPLGEALSILVPIAAALDHAHRQGIVHRDVKPGNILLREDGTPMLSDFGLAKFLDSRERLTRSSVIVGTPEYLAPEQCIGAAIGPAADIYSLGITAYEMLTGRVPFAAESPLATVLAHVKGDVPVPSRLVPSIPAFASDALLIALAKDPANRYRTASEFVKALSAAARSRHSFAWLEWTGSMAAAVALTFTSVAAPHGFGFSTGPHSGSTVSKTASTLAASANKIAVLPMSAPSAAELPPGGILLTYPPPAPALSLSAPGATQVQSVALTSGVTRSESRSTSQSSRVDAGTAEAATDRGDLDRQ